MAEPTAQEISLLKEIKENLEELCVPKKYLDTKFLLNFLRARGHSLQRAENMFLNQIAWRKEYDIDNILDWTYPQKFKYFWPVYLTGFHNTGGPVISLPFGLWDPTKVDKDYDTFIKYTHYEIENMYRMIQIRSQGKPTLHQAVIIVDLQHFGLRAITTINAFGGVLAGIRTFDANYPEGLKACIIVNAPYIFAMAWRMVKPLLSDCTLAKVTIMGYDMELVKEELLQYASADQFPRKYGGKFPDDCGMLLEKGIVNGRYFRSKLL